MKKQDLIDLYTFNTTTLSKEVSDKLLLKSGRGGVSASRDYIRANAILAEYFKATGSRDLSNIKSVDDLFKALHPSTIFRLKHYTPMLAARFDELKPAQQAELFDNPDYVATEKENGCFNYDALVTLADGLTMKIGEIVRKKLPVEVLSYNVETGKIEPKRVVNWFYNGFKGKGNWMSISDDESRRSAFKITKTHRVFSEGEFKEVKDVKTLTKLVEISSEINYGLLYNYTPESLVECDFEGGSYDIEVEDNHNYFVGEFLVHNCRGWLINYKGTTKLYSRNYSDKDCSLLEYWQNIDQESSWNEGIYAVDCFSGDSRVTLADGSLLPIKKVKPGMMVKTFNTETGCVEDKEVISVIDKGLLPKDRWTTVKIDPFLNRKSKRGSGTHGFRSITCTKDHRFYQSDGSWECAENLQRVNVLNRQMSWTQEQLLLGWIMSDGILYKNGMVGIKQKYDEIGKFNYISEYFRPFGVSRVDTLKSFGKINLCGEFLFRRKYVLNFYKKYYNNGQDYISMIRDMDYPAVASLIMGDGSYCKGGCSISVHSYTEEQFEALQQWFESRGYKTTRVIDKRVKTGCRSALNIHKHSYTKLSEIISPYFPPCFRYKLSEFANNKPYEKIEDSYLGLQEFQVTRGECKQLNHNHYNLRAWDLEIKDNHNFFVENVLVHNCEVKFETGVDIRKDLEEIGLTTDSPLEAMTALLHTYPSEAKKIQQKYKALTGKDLIVFRLIHPLYFKGKNYITKLLGEGQDVYDECVEFGKSIGINIKPIERCAGTRVEKEMFLDTILNNGGEGIVFHNRKGSYNTSENRSKNSFIKLKRSVSSTMNKEGLGDTIDAFVTGYKLGKVGTANEGLISVLNVSIYVNNNGVLREHFIAAIPNIDLATKKRCTLNDASGLWPQEYTASDGTTQVVSLSPEFGGLCMEVDGQALSSKSQRLEHPRMIRWRLDKIPEMCVYTQEFLDSQTTASVHNNGKIGYQSVD